MTGPYASVNCTLTLLKSSIRKTPIVRDGGYAREDAEDDRFSDYFGSLQSIVTSSGQNDSGLFETNLRDERYLPFENSGVDQRVAAGAAGQPSKDDPASSTTTRSATSSCTSATPRAKVAVCCATGAVTNLKDHDRGGAGGGIGAAVLGAARVPHRVGEVPGPNAGRQPALRAGAQPARRSTTRSGARAA